MRKKYTHPTKQLLVYGDCREVGNHFDEWPNYLELGFTKEHIPQLIQMATDEELNWADEESLEVWAPAHAWRTLGQLRAEEAIEPLLDLLHRSLDDDYDEWISDELPYVYGNIGAKAIPALAKYLADKSNSVNSCLDVCDCLKQIGSMQPETRDECVFVLIRQLNKLTDNDPEVNAFLVNTLVDLKAVESLPNIKQAYEKKCVDYTILGDYEDAEILMGVRQKRSTPANYPTLADKYPWMKPQREAEQSTLQVVPEQPMVGRNDPCPCGSGNKYKNCCIHKTSYSLLA